MTIGETIKTLRKARQWNAETLAERTGIAPATIYRYENGTTREPKMSMLRKIADALGVDVWEIVGFNEVIVDDDPPQQHPLPSNLRPMDQFHRQRVQLIGKVAAGQPIMAETDYETFVDAPVDCDAALEVQGDSMTPTYLPGDIVYIKHRPDVENGQVAVVLLDDSATLKHVYHDPDGLILISDNPAYAPIRAHSDEYTYIAIYGVPVGYTRIYRKDPLRMIHKGLK